MICRALSTVAGSPRWLQLAGHAALAVVVIGYVIARFAHDPGSRGTTLGVALLVTPCLIRRRWWKHTTRPPRANAKFGPSPRGVVQNNQSYHLE